ncbi:MAG: radical SAM protein, partial [Candidatus Aenigmarchaeota archaeon]|nr:radical SAM protein [Candidatus Aenigmarchaeota archaeon]
KLTFDLVWRCHSYRWVEQQLDYLEGQLHREGAALDGVGLWDDMIFGRGRDEHIERAKRILKVMHDHNYGYLLEVRANQLIATCALWNEIGITREADLYKFLKETGCIQVFVGTESGNQETLNLIQKGTKLKDYFRLVELSHDVGLPLRFSMIVGFPGETERSVNDTLDLVERLEEEPYVSVSGPKLFTPYPGTPQYDAAVKCGMKVPKDTLGWSYITRYADYRAIYPWLNGNYSKETLARIDSFWEKVQEENKYQPKEETILNIVRGR